MGCYDTVILRCPKCGDPYYAQSNSGECLLREYDLDNCPQDVLVDVNRHAPFACDCGAVFHVALKPEIVLE
jgi:hypothetical protein